MKVGSEKKSKTKKQVGPAAVVEGDNGKEENGRKIGRKRPLPVFPKPATARIIPQDGSAVTSAETEGGEEQALALQSLDPNAKAALQLVLEDTTELDPSVTRSTSATDDSDDTSEDGAQDHQDSSDRTANARTAAEAALQLILEDTEHADDSRTDYHDDHRCGDKEDTTRLSVALATASVTATQDVAKSDEADRTGITSKTAKTRSKKRPSEIRKGDNNMADTEAKAAAKANIKADARMEAMAVANKEAKAAAKKEAKAAAAKTQNMMMDNSSTLSYSTRRQRLAWAAQHHQAIMVDPSNNSSNHDLGHDDLDGIDLEAGVVPMPPSSPTTRSSIMSKGGGGSGHFSNDCSSIHTSRRISASIPGAVRVRGIDSTDDDDDDDDEGSSSDDDDSQLVDIDAEISDMFDAPPLELHRNHPRNAIPQSRPGAFCSPPGCYVMSSDFSTSHRSNITVVTDPTGSSMLSLMDPLKASLVKSRGGLTQAEHELIAKEIEEALEVKPFSEVVQDEQKNPKEDEESPRCAGSRFYGLLRVLCFLWVVGFVVGLIFQPDTTNSSSNDASSNHGFKPRIPRTNPHDSSSSDSTDDTSSPASSVQFYPPFNASLLRPAAINLIQEDPESPHYKANRWLLQDPSLHDYPDWRKLQRFALATQYWANDGNNWIRTDHWLSYNVSECFWYGIGSLHGNRSSISNKNTTGGGQTPESCDKDGRIIFQNLSNNNLVGRTPKCAQLPTIQRVDKSNNSLSGRLPYVSSIIEELVFSHNNFEGPLVVDGGITSHQNNLRILKLNGNNFTGFVHKGFSLFSKLQILNLTDNQFEGTVPVEVQYLPNLSYFGLGNNHYFGTIPNHFGLLSQLQELDLSGNEGIHGTIPPALGSLTLLKKLDISDTAITGDLPEELCTKQAAGELVLVANCSLVQCCRHSL